MDPRKKFFVSAGMVLGLVFVLPPWQQVCEIETGDQLRAYRFCGYHLAFDPPALENSDTYQFGKNWVQPDYRLMAIEAIGIFSIWFSLWLHND